MMYCRITGNFTRYYFVLFVFFLGSILSSHAQNAANIRVSGKVVNASGTTLAGVSITVKGSNQATSTQADGQFQLLVAPNAILKFNYIGFEEKEVSVNNRTNLSVTLEESATTLTEVVVVGASLKQKNLTGSVVSVNEKTLNERPVTSIDEALQGRAAGVFVQTSPQPGSDATIRIRGNNSMNYGGKPIYVVDGIVMEEGFNMLNLNDVVSVNVLKDASATALYGSRGAQGVVVVTTKKGTSGVGKISYDGWAGVQQFTNTDLTLGAKDIYELRIDALSNSHVATDFYKNNPGATYQDFLDKELFGAGKLWFAEYEKKSYAEGKNYNWLDEVTRSARQQNHSLSFSGGGEKNTYYMSFGLNNQDGLVKNSNYKRYSGRINAEQNIKSWLKVGTNTSYTSAVDAFVDGKVFEVARGANPLMPISADPLILSWGNNNDVNLENPLRSLQIDKDRTRNRILSANYVNINPLEGLNIRSTFSIDATAEKYFEYIPSTIQQAKRDSYKGRAIHNRSERNNFQWDNSITYDKRVEKHNFSGLFSTSISKDQYNFTNVTARDFPSDDFWYYALGAAYDKKNFELGSNFESANLMSYLGRVNYDYDDKYFATVTGRYDGSSKFSPDNRWGFFPSVALAWNINKESFLADVEQIDLLKLRLGYGSVGNQRLPNYMNYSLYRPSFSSTGVTIVSKDDLRGTPGLRWERQKQFNVALDLGLFNNRVNFTAEYFDIVNSDLLMKRNISSLLGGFSNAIENIGEMTNRGVEFTLSGTVLNKNDFKWDLSANLSADKNKITKLYGNSTAIYNIGGWSNSEIQREGNFFLGQSVNTIYMWEFDRIIQESDMPYVNSLSLPGKTLRPGDILPKDQQKEGEPGYGVIDADDRVVVGKKDPKFYGGFSSNFTYKGISLNAVFVYSYGAKAVSGYYESLMNSTGYGPAHKDMLNRWTPTNTNTNIPRATYDNSIRFGAGETSWGIQDASFLRLATLTLGYDLPKTWLSKAGFSGLRVYATGNNVFTATKYKGYDPEHGDWYPTAKMFVMGLNVSL